MSLLQELKLIESTLLRGGHIAAPIELLRQQLSAKKEECKEKDEVLKQKDEMIQSEVSVITEMMRHFDTYIR